MPVLRLIPEHVEHFTKGEQGVEHSLSLEACSVETSSAQPSKAQQGTTAKVVTTKANISAINFTKQRYGIF